MQKGKGSTASPPAVANRGQQSSQRGPTPPQQRQDDYSQRNSQGYQPQQMNVQSMMFQPQGMVQQQQGQVQRMPQPFYPRALTRPMRIQHSPQPTQHMYQSPPTVQQLMQMPGGPQYAMQQQPYVQQQVDYQTVQVGNPQMQYRPPTPQMSGGYNPQMQYQAYSPSASMPPQMQFVPATQPQLMYIQQRNPQITQSIPGTQSYQQPVRQQEPQPTAPRKRNIIQIKDPNQDNKDITEEVLALPKSKDETTSASPSITTEPNVSGQSSNSNTPPINSNLPQENATTLKDLVDVRAQFAAQVVASLHDSNEPSKEKAKIATAQVPTPTQVVKSTSPKQFHPKEVKVISIEKKNSRPVETAKKEEPKPEVPKPQVKPEEIVQPEVTLDNEEKPKSEVDGAAISSEVKPEVSENVKPEIKEVSPEMTIIEPVLPSKTDVSESTAEPAAAEEAEQPEEQVSLEIKPEEPLESLPNGSISPVHASEDTIPSKEVEQDLEMAPPTDNIPSSETLPAIDIQNSETPEEVETKIEKQEINVPSEVSESITQSAPEETTVNGIESEHKAKPSASTSESNMKEHKRKKLNKRLKEMDKKPDQADLMDAYKEAPAKEVKEEPVEEKEAATKNAHEEKVPSEDETWEAKDEQPEEGMWSPEENKDGPRFYDRDFLLQFQFNPVCTAKPEGLPDIEVVLQSIANRPPIKQPYSNRMGSSGGGGVDFMMPSFMRQQPGRPNQPNMARSNKGGRAPPKKVILTLDRNIELSKSENRWVRPSEAKNKLGEDEKKTQEIIRKFRGILNKLTPQKFQTLIQKVMELEIDTPERLDQIINIIFEKAINEPGFSVAYANMCRCLIPKNVKVESKDGKDTTITFRKILLNKCQKEFEREKSDEINIHVRMEELLKEGLSEEVLKVKKAALAMEELLSRRRTLGNIRFIGELFKLKMLTESIMHDCVIKLLKSNDEESFECLCKLLSTIGKDLDHVKAKPRMEQYFDQINKIIETKKTSARCRFMLQDVKDLRTHNWVPRRDDNNPKTIDQIHKEAAEEERKMLIMINQQPNVNKKRDNQHKGRDSPRPTVPQADEAWTTVPGRPRNVSVDPKKFQDIKKRTNVDTESISLGPGGRGPGMWARGSSGGSGPAAMPGASAEQETRGNRFSALGGEGRRGGSRQGSGAGRQDNRSQDNRSQDNRSQDNRSQDNRSQGPTTRHAPQNDREKALEAVRSVVQNKARPEERDSVSPPPTEPEVAEVKLEETPPAVSPPPPSRELTEEEIEHKTMGLIDEFHDIKDIMEATQCVQELNSPGMLHKFVEIALNHSMEKHSSERIATGRLMFTLLKMKIVSLESYMKGFEDILEFAEDMEIDIPQLWKYLGELVGPCILENGLPLTVLSKSAHKLIKDKRNVAKLLAEILISGSNDTESPATIASLWSQSGLSLRECFNSEEDEMAFIENKNLKAIVCGVSSEKPHASSAQDELRDLFLGKKASNEEVFIWIDANVQTPKEPQFIRALVTAVCESCRKGDSDDSCERLVFKEKCPLLQKYIDNNRPLELQALFALQALSVQLHHPRDFLKSFFNGLYDEEVVSEDAFYDWENDSTPSESQGKGTAKTSTVQFFEWLRSAEEDKQTDDG